MRLPMSLRLVLTAASLLLVTSAGAATAQLGAVDGAADDAAAIARSWRSDPVYVSRATGVLGPADADDLRSTIEGWRDDVWITVLPARTLREAGGRNDYARAANAIEALYDANAARDGVYLVSFSGGGVYGAAYGTDDPVGAVLDDAVRRHSVGETGALLAETLAGLGAGDPAGSTGPGDAAAGDDAGQTGDTGSSSGSDGVPVPVVAMLVLVAALGGAAVYLLMSRARRSPIRRPSGETWDGPADFRPDFAVQPDEHDTTEERAALAREDVTRLGEELDAADLPTTDPAVAEHVQAALDAYADASARVDSLTDDEELRSLGRVVEYARWRHACAEAVLAGRALPPRRSPCFVDEQHGISIADGSWAPPGGTLRPVPLCESCLRRISGEA